MLNIEKKFLSFIEKADFPCIGAKASAKKKKIHFVLAKDLTSSQDDVIILSNIYQFIESWKKEKEHLQTLVVIFDQPCHSTELEFENNLWARLQSLHDLDAQLYPWDESASAEISNPKFSFSLGGHSFFIVGMHPHSSRKARQFERPALVFNLHEQFEKLRDDHVFQNMRDKIRENDYHFSGAVNPMVTDFGNASEALQYSGREVQGDFPFNFKQIDHTQTGWITIPARSGAGFILKTNQLLIVEDIFGEQVADLFCFSLANKKEYLSSGKSIDYNASLFLSTNSILYSNKSNPMLSIIHDEVGRHDFLYAPCCKNLFRKTYNEPNPSNGCYEHLAGAMEEYGIEEEDITTTFNIFMNVAIDATTGAVKVLPPISKQGDKIIFRSHMDLIVGLTACSAGQSNNFNFKPIKFKII